MGHHKSLHVFRDWRRSLFESYQNLTIFRLTIYWKDQTYPWGPSIVESELESNCHAKAFPLECLSMSKLSFLLDFLAFVVESWSKEKMEKARAPLQKVAKETRHQRSTEMFENQQRFTKCFEIWQKWQKCSKYDKSQIFGQKCPRWLLVIEI